MSRAPLFVSFWHGTDPGPIERLSIKSFVQAGSRVKVYSYSPWQILDELGVGADASEIVDRAELFENPLQPGSYAAFSNIFRYKCLVSDACTWFDLDMVRLAPNEIRTDYLFGFEDELGTINGAILRAPKDSEFAHLLLQRARSIDHSRVKWGQLGPRMLTQLAGELGVSNFAMERRVFYAIPPARIWELFDPERTSLLEEELSGSWGLHLWNEVLKTVGHELATMNPPQDSFFSKLYARLGIDSGGGELPAAWAQTIRKRLGRYSSVSGKTRRKASRVLSRLQRGVTGS